MQITQKPILTLLIAACLALVGCETTAWHRAQSKNSTWEYKRFVKNYPDSPHASEATTRIRELEYSSALRSATSPRSDYDTKQAFLRKYPDSEQAAAIRADLATTARVTVECPSTVSSSGTSENPTWHFTIRLRESNGIGAKMTCTSIRSYSWYHPNPPKGNATLRPNGTASYSSWLRGKTLRGSSVSVSFRIEDENGHTFSKTAGFQLK
jgi:hypothetical protein